MVHGRMDHDRLRRCALLAGIIWTQAPSRSIFKTMFLIRQNVYLYMDVSLWDGYW